MRDITHTAVIVAGLHHVFVIVAGLHYVFIIVAGLHHVFVIASVSFKRLCIFGPKGAIQIHYYYYYYYYGWFAPRVYHCGWSALHVYHCAALHYSRPCASVLSALMKLTVRVDRPQVGRSVPHVCGKDDSVTGGPLVTGGSCADDCLA